MKTILTKTLLAAASLCTLGLAHAQQPVLRIGVEGAYAPFNAVDASGKPYGFDVDIANALCDKMQVRCQFVVQDWDGLLPALMARKFDAIISSMTETEERARQVNFTKPYYRTTLVIAVPKDSRIADVTPASMKGQIIGAQSSTYPAAYAEDNYKGATVRLYPTYDEAGADLLNGRIDAAIYDKMPLVEWLQKSSKGCCKMLGDVPGTESHVGIVVRKGDHALRERFNKALDDIRADATYQKISTQYFGMDIY